MIIKDRFFFFGFGQTAKYLVSNLKQSKKNFSFSATNTKKTTLKTYDKKNLNLLSLKINFTIKK